MKKAMLFLAAVIVMTSGTVAPAIAAEDDHIYCLMRGESVYKGKGDAFYTAVFLGDYSFTAGHINDFRDYLEREYKGDYGGDLFLTESYCFHEDTATAAGRRLQREMKEDEREDLFNITYTGWTPDSDGFSNQDIKDFRITIDGDSDDLKICVRDHECEDGDRVRVSIDGSRIFDGEIDNGWDCDRVSVQSGREYEVELYAINGTGGKGAHCSHADVNTGEIRVEGATTQTQSWKHRGGAGSRARIIVNTR